MWNIIEEIFSIFPHTYHFWCSSFLCLEPHFHVVIFPSAWGTSCNILTVWVCWWLILLFFISQFLFCFSSDNNSFLRIQRIYNTVHLFKVCSSLVFSIFAELWTVASFHHPQKESPAFYLSPFRVPPLPVHPAIPSPRELLINSLSKDSGFWIFCINGIKWHVVSCDWVLSLL